MSSNASFIDYHYIFFSRSHFSSANKLTSGCFFYDLNCACVTYSSAHFPFGRTPKSPTLVYLSYVMPPFTKAGWQMYCSAFIRGVLMALMFCCKPPWGPVLIRLSHLAVTSSWPLNLYFKRVISLTSLEAPPPNSVPNNKGLIHLLTGLYRSGIDSLRLCGRFHINMCLCIWAYPPKNAHFSFAVTSYWPLRVFVKDGAGRRAQVKATRSLFCA